MLLAIDTATTYTGVAVYNHSGLLAEATWQSGRNHTTQLLPQIDMLLQHLGRARGEITVVAVALGPGSWSGLRVGMSTAKGLALACDLPLVGVGTLHALAYQHRQPHTPVRPIIRLGRERFATTALAPDAPDAPWQRSGDERNVTLAALIDETTEPTLFCGDIAGEVTTVLREALGERALFPTPAANLRRPGFLAELGWQRFQAGDVDDAALLEPIYLGQAVKDKTP